MSNSVAVPPSFFWTFFEVAGFAFVSFVSVYAGVATVVFHQPHGAARNWDKLRTQLQIMLVADDVRLCRPLKCIVVQSSIAEHTQAEVRVFVHAFSQIEAAKKRVGLLRASKRFVVIGLLFGFIIGLIFASPVLFGYPPLSGNFGQFATIETTVFGILMFFYFILPQNKTWDSLQTYVMDVSGKLDGKDLEPPTW